MYTTVRMKMTSSIFFFAGFLVLLQVVFSIPPPTSNIQEGLTQAEFQALISNLLHSQQQLDNRDYPDGGGNMQGYGDYGPDTIEEEYNPERGDMQDYEAIEEGYGDPYANTQLQRLAMEEEEEAQEQGPSKAFLKELKASMGPKGHRFSLTTAEMQKKSPTIQSGDKIALQASNRRLWMSLWGKGRPHTVGCPGLYMKEDDFTKRCVGEVFEIYREEGPGAVRVGDLVGIYYPIDKLWLGCAGSGQCYKHPCPGKPSMETGFSNDERWYKCYGEVFKIYAKGKDEGDVINRDDDIMLFFLNNSEYLSFPGGTMHRHPCPGIDRPPSETKYDRCWGEVFTIWKKGFALD